MSEFKRFALENILGTGVRAQNKCLRSLYYFSVRIIRRTEIGTLRTQSPNVRHAALDGHPTFALYPMFIVSLYYSLAQNFLYVMSLDTNRKKSLQQKLRG